MRGNVIVDGRNIFSPEVVKEKLLNEINNAHEILKKYCQDNGLKMFPFVEKLIKEKLI